MKFVDVQFSHDFYKRKIGGSNLCTNELMRTNAMDGQIFGLLHLGHANDMDRSVANFSINMPFGI